MRGWAKRWWIGTAAALALVSGCGEGDATGGGDASHRNRPEPASEIVAPASCPPGLVGCRVATGRIAFVERVDPDGDGDAHFVIADEPGITLPGLTAIDVRKGLRPRPLPGVGDPIGVAGPVQTGSYGQSQIHAVELNVGRVAVQAAFGTAGGTQAPRPGAVDWRRNVAAAERYAKGRAGDVAFALIDPSGRLRGFHVARTAPTASVVKAMLLVAYLRAHDGDRLSGGDRALLGPMIRRSDNYAATRVRDIVGRARIERLARVAGMRDFRYHPIWGQTRTSSRDQARFMYRLGSYVPGEHRAYARRLLSHIVREQRWGIARVKPRGWRLFFKGGWGSGTGLVDHQVALLTRRGRRVGVAILTQSDPDHAYGKRTLRGVAARLLRGLDAARGR